jgi:competence protein ComEC
MNRALLALLFTASLAGLAQTKPAPAPAAKPAPAPAVKAAPPATTGALVANKSSKIYHRADCKFAAKIKDSNKTSFASAAEATKAGFKPCKECKP